MGTKRSFFLVAYPGGQERNLESIVFSFTSAEHLNLLPGRPCDLKHERNWRKMKVAVDARVQEKHKRGMKVGDYGLNEEVLVSLYRENGGHALHGVRDGEVCETCEGPGRRDGIECPKCEGTKVKPYQVSFKMADLLMIFRELLTFCPRCFANSGYRQQFDAVLTVPPKESKFCTECALNLNTLQADDRRRLM